MYENQLEPFVEERELETIWCVFDKFDNLQEQKPDRECDEWKNGLLIVSFIASIGKENAIDPKFANKNWPGSLLCGFFFLQKLDKIQWKM